MELDLSMVPDDDFHCYITSEGKHTNLDDELQTFSKETNLTPQKVIKRKEPIDE